MSRGLHVWLRGVGGLDLVKRTCPSPAVDQRTRRKGLLSSRSCPEASPSGLGMTGSRVTGRSMVREAAGRRRRPGSWHSLS